MPGYLFFKDSNFVLEVNVNKSPGNRRNSYSGSNAVCKTAVNHPQCTQFRKLQVFTGIELRVLSAK